MAPVIRTNAGSKFTLRCPHLLNCGCMDQSQRQDRPYHSAWHEDEVYTYLRSQSGKLFDPRLVNEFLQMLKDHPDLEYLI